MSPVIGIIGVAAARTTINGLLLRVPLVSNGLLELVGYRGRYCNKIKFRIGLRCIIASMAAALSNSQ